MTTKQDIIKDYQLSPNDCGSLEVQIACLTQRINALVGHLKQHKKDNHTRNGLLTLVGRRKRFIRYLKKKKPETLATLAKKLKFKIK